MMSKSAAQFAHLLSQAIRHIALRENTKIQVVQDELGYTLGRETGGSAIEYWRKGHIPAELSEVETLARLLIQRGGLTSPAEVEQFLYHAQHPNPTILVAEGLLAQVTAPPPALPPEHPPFLVGPPISHPAYFFGREREIKRLFNLWQRRPLQNGAIIGPRRSGKTSLLHYLQNISRTPPTHLRAGQRHDWLAAPETYRWVLVDFQDARLGHQAGLLTYLLAALELPRPDPCTLDRFLDVISQKLRTPTVILLDELDVALQRYSELDEMFWEGLRAVATNQVEGNLAFGLASQAAPTELARHSGIGSPFFNIFGYTAHLKPLTEAEAEALIASAPLPFPAADIEWILEQSGRWPILLQILCRERLLTLEEGEPQANWREEGLTQMAMFRYLLA